MRIGIYHNALPITQQLVDRLTKLLHAAGLIIDHQEPDIVLSVGGDGTLLGAFRHYEHRSDTIRFVGVHTGHLGFYTDWVADDLEELVASLVNDDGQRVSYPLLAVTATYENGATVTGLALNEVVIKQPIGSLVADVFLAGEHFERFRGDGLAISTPTGSTAYNKSNGGAVLHPQVPAIQLTEIAAINNRVYRTLGSPMIVPRDYAIRLVPTGTNVLVMCDQQQLASDGLIALELSLAQQRVHFAEYRHVNFWQRVRQSFISDPHD